MESGSAVRIGGRSLDLAGDDATVAALHPALARLEAANGSVDASLDTLVEPDPLDGDPWRDLTAGSHRRPDGAIAIVQRDPSLLETYQPGHPPRLEVRSSPDALRSGDLRAQPARYAIASWLASPGSGPPSQMVHAGAAAFEGRGVLFVGAGGRGKSTITLACVRGGFAYLGDDMCIVEPGDSAGDSPPRVHGVYATAKLNDDSRSRLGVEGWSQLGTTPVGKTVLLLPPEVPFGSPVPLVAIVVMRVGGPAAKVDPAPLPPGRAVGMLGSTALPVANGSGTPRQWLATAASLVRTVPTFELAPTWDLQGMASAVHRILQHCDGRSRPG